MIASSLTDLTVTTTDVAVFAAVIGGIIAAAKGLIWFLDRFYAQKDVKTAAQVVEAQNAACRTDHHGLNSILIQQNAHISKLLEHMGTFLHTSELRHQAVLAQLELQHHELREKLRNIYYQMPKRPGERTADES
ncbi:MAG: hypothetical protein ACOYM3_07255 [Terrimicrobiaceae bacterium]